MKRKYLLRGIGIGLIVGVLVGYTAFKTGDFTERPQEQSTSSATEAITTEKTSTEKISTEAPTTELITEKTTTEQATENRTTEQITEKPTTEQATTEQVTEIVTEKPTTELITEEPITEEPTTEKVTVEPVTEKPVEDKASITVIKGMSSDRIAELVQAAGVIDDYRDFDRWLSVNGYDRSLKVGTFELKKGMSYEEIARILTGK